MLLSAGGAQTRTTFELAGIANEVDKLPDLPDELGPFAATTYRRGASKELYVVMSPLALAIPGTALPVGNSDSLYRAIFQPDSRFEAAHLAVTFVGNASQISISS